MEKECEKAKCIHHIIFHLGQINILQIRDGAVQVVDLFLLMNGDVGVFLPTNDSKEPNFKVGVNEVFGEMGVIEDKPRMASIRCMSDATVMALSKAEFDARVEKADPFIRALLRILSQTVRNLQDKK